MRGTAYYCTVEELQKRGRDDIPEQFRSNTHLIYSSPATLAFNSPGAEGFGVKRAGLAIPDSIMLIVAPGCCGRNTSMISSMPQYEDRFFYLTMDETDIVTGRHLKKVPKAVQEICDSLEKKPSVVMICITCVDALLGTDMERICRKSEEKTGLPVRPCSFLCSLISFCYISSAIASVVILTPGLFDFNTVPVYGASDRILFYVLNLLTISF